MKFVSFCTSVFLVFLTNQSVYADKLMILGDSLSAAYDIPWESGWAQLLEQELSPNHELINASVSGETTGGGLARLPALLQEHQPDWVIVELGGNDGLRGYPLQLIRRNLEQMGRMTIESGARPIFFGIRIPPNYGERYNNAFTSIFPEVAEQLEAAYLDLFIEELATNPEMMLDDRIHPSEQAQPFIKDYVSEFLDPLLVH